mgnify:CR=1 FL=1|tara:strand:- start:17 stop:574 length:558 start_codon:yes stop_codon:yes gene_type:complete
MKNLFYTLLAVSLIFSSCSKDDENVTSGSIVGSWNWTEITTIAHEGIYLPDGSKSITSSSSEVQNPGDDGLNVVQWTFSDNGVFYSFTYMSDGSAYEDTLTYVKSDNTLIIGDAPASIIELSSSKLIVNIIDEYTWTDDNQVVHFDESDQTIKFDRSTFTSDNISSKNTDTSKDPFLKGLIHNKK